MTDTAHLDELHMRSALEWAERGWGQTAPNPMVGAIVLDASGAVAGAGFHARYGEAHAEVMALAHAGERARGGTLYVTLEPCAHHGKTPPCVDAILDAGIARVVAAVADPNPAAGGGGAKLCQHGVVVDLGVCEDEARELNAAFFNRWSGLSRPFVTLKLALSANGLAADPSGERRWITGDEARREVHRMRAGVDAIAVGSGTLIADDPELTVRDWAPPRVAPTRVVFDRQLRAPLTSKLVSTAGEIPTVVIGETAAPPGRADELRRKGVDVLLTASTADAMRALFDRGLYSVLVEGGPELARGLLAAGLVDRLAIFQSPDVFANEGRDTPQFAVPANAARIVRRQTFGRDTLTVYDTTQ